MITKIKLLQTKIVVDNIYLDQYIKLINDNLFISNYQGHNHHIIPRYYYQNNNIEVDNSKDNIVNLSYIDHIKAHYYLAKCSIPKYEQSNIFAIALLIGQSKDEVESQYNSDININDFLKAIGVDENYYWSVMHKPHSEEHNQKMRQSLVGHPGFTKGKIVYNNGKTQKFIKPGDPIPDGFIKGALKRSDEYRQRCSIRMKGKGNPFYGKHHTSESKEKRKANMPDQGGKNNPFYGKHHTKESKEKMAANKSKHWYTDGINEVLSRECPENYYSGRSNQSKQNLSNGVIKSKQNQWHWYTNGVIECHTDENNFNNNLKANGFYLGRLPRKNRQQILN